MAKLQYKEFKLHTKNLSIPCERLDEFDYQWY